MRGLFFRVLGIHVDTLEILDIIELMAAMGRAARAEYEAKYTGGRNYQTLMETYEHVLRERR